MELWGLHLYSGASTICQLTGFVDTFAAAKPEAGETNQRGQKIGRALALISLGEQKTHTESKKLNWQLTSGELAIQFFFTLVAPQRHGFCCYRDAFGANISGSHWHPNCIASEPEKSETEFPYLSRKTIRVSV
jgi:hypothetical protein